MEVVFVEERPIEGAQRRVGPGTTVGRAESDVALADPDVSRRHAAFHQVDTDIGIEDLGSRNGTYVNDQKIFGIVTLSDGDRVRFGNTVWRLSRTHRGSDAEAEPFGAASRPDPVPATRR
jgi:pSer/pThr/pTyr-binding forkhead associated (FHA) protein